MGKLGGREMTASSDLDLILVYDYAQAALQSMSAASACRANIFRAHAALDNRAFQRRRSEGTLYEVDMRLRPSGQKGPVATSLQASSTINPNEA